MTRIIGEHESPTRFRVTVISYTPVVSTTPAGYDVEGDPDETPGEGDLYYNPETGAFWRELPPAQEGD